MMFLSFLEMIDERRGLQDEGSEEWAKVMEAPGANILGWVSVLGLSDTLAWAQMGCLGCMREFSLVKIHFAGCAWCGLERLFLHVDSSGELWAIQHGNGRCIPMDWSCDGNMRGLADFWKHVDC